MEDNIQLNINNNPFSFQGRITRLPFFLIIVGGIVLTFLAVIGYFFFAIKYQSYEIITKLLLILFGILITVISIFAWIKRLRDVKLPLGCIFIAFLPYLSIIFFLVLTFMKSKYEVKSVEDLN